MTLEAKDYNWAEKMGKRFCHIKPLLDDCAQVGRIAVWQAHLKHRNLNGHTSFKAYATVTIRNQVIDYIRNVATGRPPHKTAAIQYAEFAGISLNEPLNGSDVDFHELLPSDNKDIGHRLETNELAVHLLGCCYGNEKAIVEGWLDGKTHKEIGLKLGLHKGQVQYLWAGLVKRLREIAVSRCA